MAEYQGEVMADEEVMTAGLDRVAGHGVPGDYTARDLGYGYLAEMRRHAAWLHEEGLLFIEEEYAVKDIVERCDMLLRQL